jgi:peptide/nickel transport system ATP-binding protein
MVTSDERPITGNGQGNRGPRFRDSGAGADAPVVLRVEDLWVEYRTERGWLQAVRGVNFEIRAGEAVALIGESGSGKSTLGFALLRMLVRSARVSRGKVTYRTRDGKTVDLLTADDKTFRRMRWREFSMVFQAAQNSLNPVMRVSDTFQETARAHGERDKRKTEAKSIDLLQKVQLDADRVYNAYPHELSGGMRQRVSIALSLLLDPQLIILDEPTTALDIITQRAIIDVVRGLRDDLDFTMIFISHDLSLAAELADKVVTMYAGEVVEDGPVRDTFYNPKHPYTVGLLNAVPPIVGEDFTPLTAIPGATPNLLHIPEGCPFHPRCPYHTDLCLRQNPPLAEVGPHHRAACHHHDKVTKDPEVWEEIEVEQVAEAAV